MRRNIIREVPQKLANGTLYGKPHPKGAVYPYSSKRQDQRNGRRYLKPQAAAKAA